MDANSKANEQEKGEASIESRQHHHAEMDRNAQIASERVRFHHKLKILLGRWRDEMNAKPLTAASTPLSPAASYRFAPDPIS